MKENELREYADLIDSLEWDYLKMNSKNPFPTLQELADSKLPNCDKIRAVLALPEEEQRIIRRMACPDLFSD